MKWGVVGIILASATVFAWYLYSYKFSNSQILKSPIDLNTIVEKPYDKYSFERLVEREDKPSEIEIVGNKFYYYSEGRRISGEVNKPTRPGLVGVIVMARGYVDKEDYKTGMGTHNAATYYAKNGYITYAPDFSGYGDSSPEDENPLGARLVKPVEILDLIASIKTDLPIYLWGHSNGGQIMLSVTEILGKRGDTRVKAATLWAPVSKPFPYNILYYTDEADDQGKWLRGEIAKFEGEYDVYKYSIDRYLDWIKMPILIHQGTSDEPVPVKWSDDLVKKLEELGVVHEYHRYPGADHNMRLQPTATQSGGQASWNTVVARDIEFFSKY